MAQKGKCGQLSLRRYGIQAKLQDQMTLLANGAK